MARFTFVALLAVALTGLTCNANPVSQTELQGGGSVHTYDSWAYSNCGPSYQPIYIQRCLTGALLSGTPDDIVEIISLKVTPDPPQPGKDLTVDVSAFVKETIEVRTPFRFRRNFTDLIRSVSTQEGAYANVVVKLGVVKLLTRRFDLCEEAYVSPRCY
jgi:hypothetical protein